MVCHAVLSVVMLLLQHGEWKAFVEEGLWIESAAPVQSQKSMDLIAFHAMILQLQSAVIIYRFVYRNAIDFMSLKKLDTLVK